VPLSGVALASAYISPCMAGGRRRRCCRCWRRCRRTYWNQGPSATRRTTYGVAEVLAKTVVISLRACGCAEVAVYHLAVDHIETSLPFIQSQLEIGALCLADRVLVHCAPFDVEDSIGRTAAYRSVNATGSARETGAARLRIGAQVAPVGEDCSVMATPRQAHVDGERRGRGKLRIARLMLVKVVPYSVYENGSEMVVTRSFE
jgi:hypothetical protein